MLLEWRRISLYYPFLDHLITELESSLLTSESHFHTQHLLPRAVDKITDDQFISLWYFQQKSTILRGVSVCPKAAVFRLADFCWRSWYKVLLANHYVLCGRQTTRVNHTAKTPKQYWRISLYYPFLDHLITELESSLLTSESHFHFCWRSWYKVLLANHYVLQWLRYLETSLLKSSNDKSMSARYASKIKIKRQKFTCPFLALRVPYRCTSWNPPILS
jgi:hypothetical protein